MVTRKKTGKAASAERRAASKPRKSNFKLTYATM
jgi:hypothetical protein